MNTQFHYLSTLPNAPEPFRYLETLNRNHIRRGVFALYIKKNELDPFKNSFADILEKLSGIILTEEMFTSFTAISSQVWHLGFTSNQLPGLPLLLHPLLTIIQSLRDQTNWHKSLDIELKRTVTQYKRLSEFHTAAQDKIRISLAEHNKWTSTALTKLVRFAANELQVVSVNRFNDMVMNFLMDTFFGFQAAVLLKKEKNKKWSFLERKGKSDSIKNELVNNLPATIPGEPWEKEKLLFVPITLLGSVHLLVLKATPPKYLFTDYELSFFTLFSSLISSTNQVRTSEKKLLESKEAAEAASKSKNEFLANMSHEIRTPLNGVLGMLQLLQTTGLDEEQKEYVETAITSGKSLLTIINDILDFSKIEARKIEFTRETFYISHLLETTIKIFSNEALRKQIHLYFEIDAQVPEPVVGDSSRLRQILFNLLGNAIKFTEKGTVNLKVKALPISPNKERIFLHFSVTDTGIGIPAERLNLIFQPFSQVDGSYTRKYQGTGLGLSIVKRLVELMGGTISVDSQVGEGTRICFDVSMLLPSPPDLSSTIPGNLLVSSQPAPAEQIDTYRKNIKLNILVAEDNAINRKLISRFLEKLGYLVTAVDSGAAVIEKMQTYTFDLILMDIQMPDMDGIETTQRIRSNTPPNQNPGIPIIAITAHAMKGDKERFLNSGMNDYISKPIDQQELKRAITRIANPKKPGVAKNNETALDV